MYKILAALVGVILLGSSYLAIESAMKKGVNPIHAKHPSDRPPSPAKLYLVGWGPGDPDLMTVRAADVLKRADKVFCFPYMTEAVTPLAKSGAVEQVPTSLTKRHYGKKCKGSLVAGLKNAVGLRPKFHEFAGRVRGLVRSGKTVAIVDAGDPLIFGPWAWITEELEDLPLEVVPGISSLNAANAALKTDVMWGGHRSVLLSGGDILGRPDKTGRMSTPAVFFTHKVKIHQLVPRLLERYPADTPIAIVSDAGFAEKEKVIRATLGTILDVIKDKDIPFLHLIYVGDILTLKHK